jgi:drug/metabolite transporter (DMT)-like permease
LALIGTTAWSIAPLFYQFMFERYPALQPLTLIFWRDLAAGVVLAVILLFVRPAVLRIGWRDLPFLAAYGIVGIGLINGLWIYSVRFNGAAIANVLVYSSTAFAVLLAWLLLKESLTWRKAASVALTLAGVALVAGAFQGETRQLALIGLAVGVAAGLTYAGVMLAARWSAGRYQSSWTLVVYGLLFAVLGLAPTQTPETLFALGTAWEAWGLILVVALGPTLAGFGLYTASLRLLPAGIFGIVTSLEVGITAVLATVILGDRLSAGQWLGAGLTLVAVLVVQGEALIKGAATPAATEEASAPSA